MTIELKGHRSLKEDPYFLEVSGSIQCIDADSVCNLHDSLMSFNQIFVYYDVILVILGKTPFSAHVLLIKTFNQHQKYFAQYLFELCSKFLMVK